MRLLPNHSKSGRSGRGVILSQWDSFDTNKNEPYRAKDLAYILKQQKGKKRKWLTDWPFNYSRANSIEKSLVWEKKTPQFKLVQQKDATLFCRIFPLVSRMAPVRWDWRKPTYIHIETKRVGKNLRGDVGGEFILVCGAVEFSWCLFHLVTIFYLLLTTAFAGSTTSGVNHYIEKG